MSRRAVDLEGWLRRHDVALAAAAGDRVAAVRAADREPPVVVSEVAPVRLLMGPRHGVTVGRHLFNARGELRLVAPPSEGDVGRLSEPRTAVYRLGRAGTAQFIEVCP